MHLRAGFCSLDITPRTPVPLAGYDFPGRFFDPRTDTPREPLFARALALSDEETGTKLLLVSLDLCVLTTAVAAHLRARLAEENGLPVEAVLLCCTHTHSGPFAELEGVGAKGERIGQLTDPKYGPANETYGAFLAGQLSLCAGRALAGFFPASARLLETPLTLGYDRRVPQKGKGHTNCWNPQEQYEMAPGPSPDPTCTLLDLAQVNGPRRELLYSIGLHPTAFGKLNTRLSPDWPGAAARALEEAVPGARAMCLQGASGEIHPWIATQERAEGVELVGRAVGSGVALFSHATRPLTEAPEGRPALACRELSVDTGHTTVNVTVWRLGGLLGVGLPFEYFARSSAALRRRLGRPLMLATMANGWEAYWPPKEAFEEGGYEVWIAKKFNREPGEVEAVEAALLEAFETL